MLEMIDGMIVANTAEGRFELTISEAHRAITEDFLIMMDNDHREDDPDKFTQNVQYAIRLYSIGKQIYNSEELTEEITNDDLMPLLHKISEDKCSPHISYLVMRYVVREYYYKITYRAEVTSLYNFYYAMRDPIFKTILKKTTNTETYHRLALAFFAETQSFDNLKKYAYYDFQKYDKLLDMSKVIYDRAKEGKRLPELPAMEWCSMNPELVIIPYEITCWASWLQAENYLSKEDAEPFLKDMNICKTLFEVGKQHTFDDKLAVDVTYKHFKQTDSPIREAYSAAKKEGFYAAAYYVAQAIASDQLKFKIAKELGVKSIYNYHVSEKRAIKKIIMLLIFAVVGFVGYKILLGIKSFFGDAIFWFLVFVAVGACGSTPETRSWSNAGMGFGGPSSARNKMIQNGVMDPVSYYVHDTMRGEAMYLLYKHGYAGFFDF